MKCSIIFINFLSIFKLKKKKSNEVVCENIVASIAKCKVLHRRLIILAHPDKHPNNKELAEELTKLLNKERYNYSELLKLQVRIKSELR